MSFNSFLGFFFQVIVFLLLNVRLWLRRLRTVLRGRRYINYDDIVLETFVVAVCNKEMSRINKQAKVLINPVQQLKILYLHPQKPGRQKALTSAEEEEILKQALVYED